MAKIEIEEHELAEICDTLEAAEATISLLDHHKLIAELQDIQQSLEGLRKLQLDFRMKRMRLRARLGDYTPVRSPSGLYQQVHGRKK